MFIQFTPKTHGGDSLTVFAIPPPVPGPIPDPYPPPPQFNYYQQFPRVFRPIAMHPIPELDEAEEYELEDD